MIDRLTTLVIIGTRLDARCFRSEIEIGSATNCCLGQFERILRISDLEAGVKEEISGGVVGEVMEMMQQG